MIREEVKKGKEEETILGRRRDRWEEGREESNGTMKEGVRGDTAYRVLFPAGINLFSSTRI